MLSGTVLPIALGVGVAIGGYTLSASISTARADQAKPRSASSAPLSVSALRTIVSENPTARSGDALPVQLASCAAKKKCGACGGCGACKAKCGACKAKCGACSAKKKCGGCGGCGACGGSAASLVSTACVVPRLQKAAACGAAKCGACGAKKKCGACGACKAKCGACGAKKKCGACGGCGAAKKCGACGACGGAGSAELNKCEAAEAYKCLLKEMKAAYAKSGVKVAKDYYGWRSFNKVAYVSATHGSRYVNNFASPTAASTYVRYDKAKKMRRGGTLVKDSFVAQKDGKLAIGPLFIMEKMGKGWHKTSGDWKYTMIMPNGTVAGVTKGKGDANVKFCYECHLATAEETDSMLFLPEEFRKK